MGWTIPGHTHPDAPAVAVLSTILGYGKSSLLNQRVCEKKEFIHSLGTGISDPGILWVSATADPQHREEAEKEVLQQVALLKKEGVSGAMLERAKQLLLAEHLHSLETTFSRAFNNGNSWLATGDPSFEEDYFKLIKKVTEEEVKKVAQKYLLDEKLTVTSLDPTTAPPIFRTAEAGKKPALDEGVIKQVTLSNGLRLLLYEDHRLPLVSMAAVFRAGTLVEETSGNGLTQLLASLLPHCRCAPGRREAAQELEQYGGSMEAGVDNDTLNVAVEVMKPQWKLGLNILTDVLTKATFPQEEVHRRKVIQIASIKEASHQAKEVAGDLVNKALFSAHPYALPLSGTSESVAGLTPERVHDFYKKYIVGFNGVIAIFGDIDTEEVLALAVKELIKIPAGKLASPGSLEKASLAPAVQLQRSLPTKQSILVKAFLGAPLMSPDRPVLELLSVACNNMGSRLVNQLREKKALAYFITTLHEESVEAGEFAFYLGVDPQKVGAARQELEQEIKKLVHQGLTQEELDQAKKKILRSEVVNNQRNAHFAAVAAKDELLGLGYAHQHARAAEVKKVTLQTMNRVIQKYLGKGDSAEVVVGP